MLQFPSPHAHVLPADIPLVGPPGHSRPTASAARIVGSLLGMAVGDALGASVEFRPREYLLQHPVTDMAGGGTWSLQAGQWTDDSSMALCLAASLITCKTFNPYDQMVRYKWWYKHGYLSAVGKCFDIGASTRNALEEFSHRQQYLKKYYNCKTEDEVDRLPLYLIKHARFDYHCGAADNAGNGALMRLCPIALVYHREPTLAVELAGKSAAVTHGDARAIDANRYYSALIVAAVRGESKAELLSPHFYTQHRQWFGEKALHTDILAIAAGSYKRPNGYDDGIRGKGFVVQSREAALWAFWSGRDFHEGALKAVNLGDDTDTTAAIYGQLAGAFYGYQGIPKHWLDKLYARSLLVCTARWLETLYFPPSKNSNLFWFHHPRTYLQSVSRSRSETRPAAYRPGLPVYTYSRQHVP